MIRHLTLAAIVLAAGPALAESHMTMTYEAPTGDAAAGESAFRQCQTCHVVQNADGEVLAGRNAKTGPNLFGVIGNTYGYDAEFDYSDIMVAAHEKGEVDTSLSSAPVISGPVKSPTLTY